MIYLQEGMKREFILGQRLRKEFNDFLGEYKPEEVYAYSTDFDRTKMSLQLVLAGLYPPTNLTKWSDSIEWSPIPTFYEPFNHTFLYANYKCPR